MWSWVGAAVTALLGVVVWFLNNRAKTRLKKEREEAAAVFKEAQDALRDGNTRALGRVLDWLRTHEKR